MSPDSAGPALQEGADGDMALRCGERPPSFAARWRGGDFFRGRKVRTQINLIIAALALPLAVLLAFHLWRAAEEREASAVQRLATLAQAAAAETAQFLRRTEALLARLAARPDILSMGRQGCDAVFATFTVQNPDFTNLLLADGDGMVRCSALARNVRSAASASMREVFQRARDERKPAVGQPEIGLLSGRWVFPVAVPVRDGEGGFLGAIGVGVDLERLRLLGSYAADATGAEGLLLVGDGGLVLAAGEGAALKVGMRLDASVLAGLSSAGGSNWVPIAGPDGSRRLYARAPVPGTAWFVVAATDAAPLRAGSWQEGLLYGGLSALGLLCGLWLARRIERAVVAPIDRLAKSAAAIAGGETLTRVAPEGAAEVAATGRAFNRMLDALEAERRRAGHSEEELRLVLASIDEVVFALSADGAALLYLSAGAERLYGADVRHFSADPALRHSSVLEEDRPRVAALAGQVAQSDRGDVEYRIRRGDGAVRWLRERCRLLRGGDGRPWRLTGILSDITPVRELVEGLMHSEARFRSLAELSADWYWEQDAEYRFIEITGAPAGRIGAIVNDGIIGQRRWEVPSVWPDATQWAAHRARVERHEPFRGFEYGIEYRKDGGTVFVSVSGEPVFDAAGAFRGYRGVGSDITARMRMETALRESEARLQWVLEATSEGVWDYDAQGGTTYFSPRFAELLGYADQRELKRAFAFSEALHPDDRARALAAQARLLEEGARFDQVYRLRRKDGGYRWFHGRGIAVRGDARTTRFVGAIADVTEKLEAEAQLRKLSAAIEQSPASIIITDTRGSIEYVNPRFCQSTGYALDEVRGCNPRILKSGETPAAEYRRLWETISRGEEWSGELHNRRKNGELFWEFVRIIPLVSEDGAVTNYLAVKEDITLRKELAAREQLRQEQMLHHARLAAMGEMAAALAHELNQPLAAIASFSGVAEHRLEAAPPDLDQAREVLRTIKGQALRAGEIVWRVREFSRRQAAEREPADLNALVDGAVRLADIAAKPRGVVYEYDLEAELPPVPVDRLQIEQVLLNLIRNGLEAMEGVAGEQRLTLASRIAADGAAVRLSVGDRGCGLPEHIATELFTPFITTKPGGLGLGLSISRGIVEGHGGRLWAAPREGGGTVFHFTLPLLP